MRQSDSIREEVIDRLTGQPVPSKDAYFALNQHEFGGHPVFTMCLTPTTESFHEVDQTFVREGRVAEIGALRRGFVRGSYDAWHVEEEHLPEVAAAFFAAIDRLRCENEDDFLRKISLVQAVTLIAHFPIDAAGRTNEDFLVYLSQKLGYPLTHSVDGFRGLCDEEWMQKQDAAQTAIFARILWRFSLSSKKKVWQSENNVPLGEGKKSMDEVVRSHLLPYSEASDASHTKSFTGPTSRALQKMIAFSCIQLINALEDPQLRDYVFANVSGVRMLHDANRDARQKTYTVYPAHIATECIKLVAFILSTNAIQHRHHSTRSAMMEVLSGMPRDPSIDVTDLRNRLQRYIEKKFHS